MLDWPESLGSCPRATVLPTFMRDKSRAPLRPERGLQAASPSAQSRRPGISQRPWDCPTRKRRKRRAPFAGSITTQYKYFGEGQGEGKPGVRPPLLFSLSNGLLSRSPFKNVLFVAFRGTRPTRIPRESACVVAPVASPGAFSTGC